MRICASIIRQFESLFSNGNTIEILTPTAYLDKLDFYNIQAMTCDKFARLKENSLNSNAHRIHEKDHHLSVKRKEEVTQTSP